MMSEERAARLARWLLLVIAIGALALRVGVLLTTLDPIQSDEAVIGLMAQHVLNGARPVFDYGLLYHGPLEAYLTAPFIAVFGMNRLVLRIVPLVFSLTFVGAIYLLGSKLYGRKSGLLSALYAAIPAPMLTIWGLRFGAGYIVVLALGTLCLALALDLQRKARARKVSLLILLLAVSFWVHYVTGYYLLAIVLAGAIQKIGQRDRHPAHSFSPLRARISVILLGGTLLSCFLLPLLSATPLPANLVRNLAGLFTIALPVLVGFLQPSTADALFASQVTERGALYPVAISLVVMVCLAVMWVGIRRLKQGDNLLFLFAAVTLTLFTVFYSMLHGPAVLLQEPRYLLPLYSVLPLVILALLHLTEKAAWLRPVVFGGLLIFNLYGNLTIDPTLNQPYMSGKSLSDNRGLIEWLDEHGISHVYADYWIGYWLAFDSGEHIIPFIIAPGNQVGWNRYPPYVAAVQQSAHPAYVFVGESEEARGFADNLAARRIRYDVEAVGVFAVYWNLSQPVDLPLEPKAKLIAVTWGLWFWRQSHQACMASRF